MTDSTFRLPTGYNSLPRPSTPKPAQREQEEETRFMKMMKEMTERVTYGVTARLSNEVTCLAREHSTANTTILKMAPQLTTILQGVGAHKANPNPNKNNNNNNTTTTTTTATAAATKGKRPLPPPPSAEQN